MTIKTLRNNINKTNNTIPNRYKVGIRFAGDFADYNFEDIKMMTYFLSFRRLLKSDNKED